VVWTSIPLNEKSPENPGRSFNSYKKLGGPWVTYEMEFLELMSERRIEDKIDPGLIAGGCLLCSEHQPHHCHRRLVAEYLKAKWNNVEVTHLV